ncbi:MAG: class II fructose-bisphosphate aldolase [Pseudomonadota bacterium]
MPRATLSEVLQPALEGRYAVAGLVCLGWEDARAYVEAAEAEGAPVILQAGPGARANMPISVWGAMFTELAEGASVPVVSHLDHGASEDEVRHAIEAGFTSVMFDGSRLPLAENIAQTARMVTMAHASGVSCEGEIGFVGYQDGAASTGTDPDEAAQFVAETGVDAVAISAGNVHLQETPGTGLDDARIAAIEAQVRAPLVIHGGSGLGQDARRRYARETRIAKFNIGTELRQAFGTALRAALSDDPKVYDRIAILKATHDPLVAAARRVISGLKAT